MNRPLRVWVPAIATLLSVNASLSAVLAQGSIAIPDQHPQHVYPNEEVQDFMGECMGAAIAEGVPEASADAYLAFATQMCTCMIWQIQERYTVQQARTVNEGLLQNEPWAIAARAEVFGACLPEQQDGFPTS